MAFLALLPCRLGQHDWRNHGKGHPYTVGREFVIGWVYDEQRCKRCGKVRATP